MAIEQRTMAIRGEVDPNPPYIPQSGDVLIGRAKIALDYGPTAPTIEDKVILVVDEVNPRGPVTTTMIGEMETPEGKKMHSWSYRTSAQSLKNWQFGIYSLSLAATCLQ